MAMSSNSCDYFLDVLASKAPTPGGGGAAAMGGAIGMALSNMVGNLTVGKKKYAAVEDEVKALLEEGSGIIERLKSLVDEDAEAFKPLAKAYGLPKNTPEEAAHKEKTLEECSKVALSVPWNHAPGLPGHQDHERMGEIGSMLAISDVGCGGIPKAAPERLSQCDHQLVRSKIGNVDQVIRDESTSEGREQIADETLELVIGKIKNKIK